MSDPTRRRARFRLPATVSAFALAALLGVSGVVAQAAGVAPATTARADTAPSDPATPTTVSDDALPAPQIDGVVWTQTIVGDTVYAGGKFATARPAGSAPGTNRVARPNLLSYDITTGALNTAFHPTLNGQVRAIVASTDGTRLYVGGSFTTANGVARSRIVALDAKTGAVLGGFRPNPNLSVTTLALSGTTLFAGGVFSRVGSATRTRLAAFDTSNGALRPWAPTALGGDVTSMVVAPDGSKVVVGGNFTTVDGSSQPGYGLAAVDSRNGRVLPWAANDLIRNGGRHSSITSLAADASGVYGAGYVFGPGGDLEGSFRADWKNGDVRWVAACHGDTYSIATSPQAVYVAGHNHDCAALSGFPQTNPTWTYYRGLAFSKTATQRDQHDSTGYRDYGGEFAPSLLDWYPVFDVGTFTGQNQGPWSVAADSRYVVYGGEFTTVNGIQQQGLVRFAVPELAPNKVGPSVVGTPFDPDLTSVTPGTVKVSWLADVDHDNAELTYEVYRDGHTAQPVFTTSAVSTPWSRPQLGFTDTGLVPGSVHSYRITALDAFGNAVRSDGVNVTVAKAAPTGYTAAMLAQKPTNFWRFDQAEGAKVSDLAGFGTQSPTPGVRAGAVGALPDHGSASTFPGTTGASSSTAGPVPRPETSSISIRFKTTSASGGTLASFGNLPSGLSTLNDRVLWVGTDHRVHFGASSKTRVVLTASPTVTDGAWHQVVASVGPSGVVLSVDGVVRAFSHTVVSSPTFAGYWRIGGDTTWDTTAKKSNWFQGVVDDAAVFPTQLTSAQLAAQQRAAGR